MENYALTFDITDEIRAFETEINKKITTLADQKKPPAVLKNNRLKSIHATCAIEGNKLTYSQVADVLRGVPVPAPEFAVLEIKNAYSAYEHIEKTDPYDVKEILKIHGIMTRGLVDCAGKFRTGGVGVFNGNRMQIAPDPRDILPLIFRLTNWAKNAGNHDIINACVFHYEFAHIHPFDDGNGRMSRFLQSCILTKHNPVFAWLPVEAVIKDRQKEYYDAFEICKQTGNCTAFIAFMLRAILHAIENHHIDKRENI